MKTRLSRIAAAGAALAGLTLPTAFAQDGGAVPDDEVLEPTDELYFEDEPARFEANRAVERAQIVHPITAPNISEDPFITTDIRGTYVYHSFPGSLFPGDDEARLYDFQGRYAVNDKLQVFINKLAIVDIHTPFGNDHGISDIGFGVKYSVLSDWESHRFAAIGASYELGTTGQNTFYEDDEARFFATYAGRVGSVNFSGSANLRFGVGAEDQNGDSDNLSLHLHADHALTEIFSPVLELNYYKVLSNGDNVTPFSGVDLANFGGNEDEDVLTLGIGGEARVLDGVALRAAYELPLTDNEDLFGYRWTMSAIWRL